MSNFVKNNEEKEYFLFIVIIILMQCEVEDSCLVFLLESKNIKIKTLFRISIQGIQTFESHISYEQHIHTQIKPNQKTKQNRIYKHT